MLAVVGQVYFPCIRLLRTRGEQPEALTLPASKPSAPHPSPLWSFAAHGALLLAACLTYLLDPVDIVWRSIRHASHVRALEHGCFAAAAAALGLSILLSVMPPSALNAGPSPRTARDLPNPAREKTTLARAPALLRPLAIGSLLPVAGFVLLVLGELALTLVRGPFPTAAAAPGTAWQRSTVLKP